MQKNDEDLGLLSPDKRFSDDIGRQFCLEKSAKITFRKGSLVKSKNIPLDMSTKITESEHNKTCTYLGINEANGINHSMNKEKIKKWFYRRIRDIWEQNWMQKIKW